MRNYQRGKGDSGYSCIKLKAESQERGLAINEIERLLGLHGPLCAQLLGTTKNDRYCTISTQASKMTGCGRMEKA